MSLVSRLLAAAEWAEGLPPMVCPRALASDLRSAAEIIRACAKADDSSHDIWAPTPSETREKSA